MPTPSSRPAAPLAVLESVQAMRAACLAARERGPLGLVPTMGYLHAGHAHLVRVARQRAATVAMSIFVNPLQFGPGEDFERYPRDAERDRALAEREGVGLLWMPPLAEMYPEPPRVTVAPGPMADGFEGAVRPGHFAGVLTVVLKLFAVAMPDFAVFGRKDAQQAALVRRMVADFNLPLWVMVAPTVREADGLALSSRNVYLAPDERSRAVRLSRALAAGVERFRAGERDGAALAAAARDALEGGPGLAVDYVACVDPDTFAPADAAMERSLLVLAARLGRTRLIDNVVLGEGLEGDVRLGD